MIKKPFRVEEKYIFIAVIITIINFIALGIISSVQMRRLLLEDCMDDAKEIVRLAAADIDGEMFASIESTEDEAYHNIYHILDKYQYGDYVSFVYAMRPHNGELAFVVDPDPVEPAVFMEPYKMLPAMEKALQGEIVCDDDFNRDRWGDLISAYAPIYDSMNRVVGLVGVDVTIYTISVIMRELHFIIAGLISLFAVFIIHLFLFTTKRLLLRDALTGLGNHDQMLRTMGRLLRKNRLAEYTLIHADAQDFKFINQQAGNHEADLVLMMVAKHMKSILGPKEYIFSNGKDEFCLLIHSGTEEQFIPRIQSIEIPPFLGGPKDVMLIRFRMGVYDIQQGDSAETAVNFADIALSACKKQNAKLDYWFDNSLLEKITREKAILADYEVGLEKHEFQAYYQPKVNITTGRLCGAEALVRWIKKGNVVPPGMFIPILEENNLITELDFYVFERVCKDIRGWLGSGLEVVRISSNFSKLHLKNARFADRIFEIMEQYDIDAKYVEIELTESSGYYDSGAMMEFVGRMRARGVQVAIDDFGVGYSSLSFLQEIGAEVVKIDKSFFDRLRSGQDKDIRMVKNVIRMMQDMDMEIVCEGIETQDQVGFLQSVNASMVQGYFFDKPLEMLVFEDRLKNPSRYGDK